MKNNKYNHNLSTEMSFFLTWYFYRKPNLVQWTGENMSGEGPYLKVNGLLKETKSCTYESKGRFRQVNVAYNYKGVQIKACKHW